jgi:putative nucleotidyltransferase with HDIG domain
MSTPSASNHRLEQLRAVHRMTDAVSRATSVEAIYRDALDALQSALGVDRASILLFDPDGVIRFKAWRGLSKEYRTIAEGHTPWDRETVDPEPVAIPNVQKDETLGQLQANILGEGIRALAFIPLVDQGRLLGKFMLYFDRPHQFTEEEVQLARTIAGHIAFAIVRKEAEEKLRRQMGHLSALRAIDLAITATLDLRVTAAIVLDQITSGLGVDAADLLLLHPLLQTLTCVAHRGFRTDLIQTTELRLGECSAGQAALERRTISFHDLQMPPARGSRTELFSGEAFAWHLATPLVAKGRVVGVLEVFHRSHFELDAEGTDFLETLAGQAAIAVEGATMFDQVQRANLELQFAYDSTLEGWARALELRDDATEGHTRRVTEMTMSLAEKIGLKDEELLHIRRGALLHDIGKMGIPDAILHKPEPLTDEEWEVIHKHPVYAYEMLSPIEYLRPALDIPYCHHERWDGTGYPRGLKGEDIPLAARIFAVVDVWDALRTERPYHEVWSEEKAREYIRAEAGKHFDPGVVTAFLETT